MFTGAILPISLHPAAMMRIAANATNASLTFIAILLFYNAYRRVAAAVRIESKQASIDLPIRLLELVMHFYSERSIPPFCKAQYPVASSIRIESRQTSIDLPGQSSQLVMYRSALVLALKIGCDHGTKGYQAKPPLSRTFVRDVRRSSVPIA
jgi:hypothetical protein